MSEALPIWTIEETGVKKWSSVSLFAKDKGLSIESVRSILNTNLDPVVNVCGYTIYELEPDPYNLPTPRLASGKGRPVWVYRDGKLKNWTTIAYYARSRGMWPSYVAARLAGKMDPVEIDGEIVYLVDPTRKETKRKPPAKRHYKGMALLVGHCRHRLG